ncbi:MAG: ParB N-terminal domain-containing protein [Pararhizobium sp.]
MKTKPATAPKAMRTERVYLDEIEVTMRMRQLSDERVDALKSSISAIGLRTPITVLSKADGADTRMILVAGNHRLAALRQLGEDSVVCFMIDEDEIDAQLWEIDENLARSELSPSERASHVARRKEIYETRYGPAKAIGGRASATAQGKQVTNANLADASFTADTAKATGQSERAVQRDAERGTKIVPEAMEMIRGTKLDTGTYLDKLKRLPPNEQVQAATRDLGDTKRIEKERADRKARQEENERQRQENADKLPDHVRASEAAKAAARQAKKDLTVADGLTEADRIAELEEAVRALEAENAELKSRIAEDEELDRMRGAWRAGGWDKIIEKLNADHAEVVRVQDRRIETESGDKVRWMNSAKFWKKEAIRLGHGEDDIIRVASAEAADG